MRLQAVRPGGGQLAGVDQVPERDLHAEPAVAPQPGDPVQLPPGLAARLDRDDHVPAVDRFPGQRADLSAGGAAVQLELLDPGGHPRGDDQVHPAAGRRHVQVPLDRVLQHADHRQPVRLLVEPVLHPAQLLGEGRVAGQGLDHHLDPARLARVQPDPLVAQVGPVERHRLLADQPGPGALRVRVVHHHVADAAAGLRRGRRDEPGVAGLGDVVRLGQLDDRRVGRVAVVRDPHHHAVAGLPVRGVGRRRPGGLEGDRRPGRDVLDVRADHRLRAVPDGEVLDQEVDPDVGGDEVAAVADPGDQPVLVPGPGHVDPAAVGVAAGVADLDVRALEAVAAGPGPDRGVGETAGPVADPDLGAVRRGGEHVDGETGRRGRLAAAGQQHRPVRTGFVQHHHGLLGLRCLGRPGDHVGAEQGRRAGREHRAGPAGPVRVAGPVLDVGVPAVGAVDLDPGDPAVRGRPGQGLGGLQRDRLVHPAAPGQVVGADQGRVDPAEHHLVRDGQVRQRLVPGHQVGRGLLVGRGVLRGATDHRRAQVAQAEVVPDLVAEGLVDPPAVHQLPVHRHHQGGEGALGQPGQAGAAVAEVATGRGGPGEPGGGRLRRGRQRVQHRDQAVHPVEVDQVLGGGDDRLQGVPPGPPDLTVGVPLEVVGPRPGQLDRAEHRARGQRDVEPPVGDLLVGVVDAAEHAVRVGLGAEQFVAPLRPGLPDQRAGLRVAAGRGVHQHDRDPPDAAGRDHVGRRLLAERLVADPGVVVQGRAARRPRAAGVPGPAGHPGAPGHPGVRGAAEGDGRAGLFPGPFRGHREPAASQLEAAAALPGLQRVRPRDAAPEQHQLGGVRVETGVPRVGDGPGLRPLQDGELDVVSRQAAAEPVPQPGPAADEQRLLELVEAQAGQHPGGDVEGQDLVLAQHDDLLRDARGRLRAGPVVRGRRQCGGTGRPGAGHRQRPQHRDRGADLDHPDPVRRVPLGDQQPPGGGVGPAQEERRDQAVQQHPGRPADPAAQVDGQQPAVAGDLAGAVLGDVGGGPGRVQRQPGGPVQAGGQHGRGAAVRRDPQQPPGPRLELDHQDGAVRGDRQLVRGDQAAGQFPGVGPVGVIGPDREHRPGGLGDVEGGAVRRGGQVGRVLVAGPEPDPGPGGRVQRVQAAGPVDVEHAAPGGQVATSGDAVLTCGDAANRQHAVLLPATPGGTESSVRSTLRAGRRSVWARESPHREATDQGPGRGQANREAGLAQHLPVQPAVPSLEIQHRDTPSGRRPGRDDSTRRTPAIRAPRRCREPDSRPGPRAAVVRDERTDYLTKAPLTTSWPSTFFRSPTALAGRP